MLRTCPCILRQAQDERFVGAVFLECLQAPIPFDPAQDMLRTCPCILRQAQDERFVGAVFLECLQAPDPFDAAQDMLRHCGGTDPRKSTQAPVDRPEGRQAQDERWVGMLGEWGWDELVG
jgi:hypothetical protein